ncbi:MAG TPA: GNAT family N-acetyltransferase [Mesorhizobium sp.]|nr:GNAT family N-acetyltransferase [Mesorhizobium sp.]
MTTAAVRLLAPEDFAVFKQLRLEALRTVPEAFASTIEDWQDLPDEEWQTRLTNNAVFAAFRDGVPVGLMGLMRQQASKMAHRATIIMVYLREGERGSGLAQALLDALLEHARQIGIWQVELTASAENPAALRFYGRHGFQEVGRIPGGFLHEGREIDDILMVRRLT